MARTRVVGLVQVVGQPVLGAGQEQVADESGQADEREEHKGDPRHHSHCRPVEILVQHLPW
ncbi:hypothetical protein [Corynebacterium auriscanis]|uniref:hypothetical protein n=1 Tax=Corynebacterium auriscanis TaxID=99807 RepID=UPI0012ECA43E|nr:hypothetical protein [Corynebacterium auriscanis]